MSIHPVIHVEFSAIDREVSGMFYSKLFGWHISQMPELNYATFDTHAGVGGGLNPVSTRYPAGTVTVYIATDDIEATLAKAEELGAKTLVPKTEIPSVGWYAFFSDPSDNMIGLITLVPEVT